MDHQTAVIFFFSQHNVLYVLTRGQLISHGYTYKGSYEHETHNAKMVIDVFMF